MEPTQQIYRLVKQWCSALERAEASAALRQIALITNCIPRMSEQLTAEQERNVIQWLQENYPNAYLWAMSQLWLGHPASLWGKGIAKVEPPIMIRKRQPSDFRPA